MRLDGQIDPEKENPQQMYLLAITTRQLTDAKWAPENK